MAAPAAAPLPKGGPATAAVATPEPPAATAQPPAAAAPPPEEGTGHTVPPPAAPPAGTPQPPQQPQPVGQVRRKRGISLADTMAMGAISIADVLPKQEEKPLPPITLETLDEYWKQALQQLAGTEPKLVEVLKERELRVDGDEHFVIVVSNSYSASEIKPHLMQLLTILRNLSHRPKLNCAVVVEAEEREAVIYHPRDKYDAMVNNNPVLNTFRQLFPEVDY